MKNLKIDKLSASRFDDSELSRIYGGKPAKAEYCMCGCGCQSSSSHSSVMSVDHNSGAANDGSPFIPIKDPSILDLILED